MDVAHDFPHCSAVAVDLIPLQDGYVHMTISDIILPLIFSQEYALELQVGIFNVAQHLNLPLPLGAKSTILILASSISMASSTLFMLVSFQLV